MNAMSMKQYIKNNLRSFKRTINNVYKKWKHKDNLKADTLWVSMGENCLPDDILRRHNRKSFSTVFSSGRSNIEYVLQMEHDSYKNLLKKECLVQCADGVHSVIRSTYYKKCNDKYSPRHMLGFEFTHHDPLYISEDNRAFKRRIARQIKLRGTKDLIFLYHHRITDNSNLPSLRAHLNELLSLYNIDNRKCKVVLFYQSIVDRSVEKFIDFNFHQSGLLEFVCHTHDIWGGDDLDTFWAKKDDGLFAEMFSKVDDVTKQDSFL
ncbi:hypothetical protein JGL56_01820 [Salmonella enterica subsp. enterica serovar Derby]|nr:hypothetical protein [Salmonella enterica subsp. enterica serovar Derby]